MNEHQHDPHQPHQPASLPGSPTKENISEAVKEAIPCKNSLEGLLKSPGWVIQKIEADQDLWQEGAFMLAWGLAFHALYGFAVAFFGGWSAAFMTIIKAPLIAVFALVLCLPSLYIFSCIGGIRITYSQTFALASSIVAMIGLLLLGLAPIAWLFSVSTESVAFPTVMNVCGWLIAVGFATRLLYAMRTSSTLRHTIGLKWWLVIYVVVSFQMATTMRPLLERPETGWWASEKKFFVVHFFESLGKDDRIQ